MIGLSQYACSTANYFFDVFPVHPQPEPLESLTSYLTRLAETNGISSMDGLSALCFPSQDRRITRDIADCPPVSFYRLPIVGVCAEEKLLATTFFHLAAKFGRSTSPQPLSRFLSGCVSQYLRYCPICLAEQRVPYYQLLWRFLSLSCCVHHRCYLRETCEYCGKSIPLFISPFRIGICPFCKRSLKKDRVEQVPNKDQQRASACLQDIEFLLIPQPWEIDNVSIIKLIGQRLAYERQRRQLTAIEIARRIEVTLTVVEGIERGNTLRRGATLQSYIKYSDYLLLNLKEVFDSILNSTGKAIGIISSPRPICPTCQQNCYMIRDGYNRSGSQRYQCQNCFHNFTF